MHARGSLRAEEQAGCSVRCRAWHTSGHPSSFQVRLGTALEVRKHNPCGRTWVILITSLTNAIAFSGWNLQVPFCADRKEAVLEPAQVLPLQKCDRAALEIPWPGTGRCPPP